MRTLFARLLAALLLGIPTGKVWAQIGSSRDSITVDSGRSVTRHVEFVVWNTGATELEASVRLDDRNYASTPFSLKQSSAPFGCGTRASITPASIRLGPGEQRTLRLVVDSAAHSNAECWSAVVVQPTRIASRPLSSERTVPRRAVIPLRVLPAGMHTTAERQ